MDVFWFTFQPLCCPSPLNRGAGVTARTVEDARRMISSAFPEAQVEGWVLVQDVALLDQGHVVPNMGDILKRGIWYPLGLEVAA